MYVHWLCYCIIPVSLVITSNSFDCIILSVEVLEEYFGERHWCGMTLKAAVEEGMRLGEVHGKVFTWLTTTNAGSSDVCRAALGLMGIGEAELADGYLCDPTSKSTLRILARPGIVVRLTRYVGKQSGFVNRAVGNVCETLDGISLFTVRLQGTGDLVLVYPIQEDGARFLPGCYGYATTVRRARGASLDLGRIWFNQKRFAAYYYCIGRGHGYVGVSRFKTRDGCHFFGRLRRTDFLPVGPELDDEVLERGIASASSSDDDGCPRGDSDSSNEESEICRAGIVLPADELDLS